jgi:two-component system chemotaxis response regulator CheY
MTCLVVDDSRTLRMIACNMLRGLGIETLQAENGVEALAVCAQRMPDCILLDWNMPVMDGLTFLKELRARTDGNHPKVLFCTTESDLGKIALAMELGADEYIMKPYDDDILASKLHLVGLI